MSYLDHIRPKQAPTANASGVFKVTPEQRARRFLILGNEGGTYYASEQKLTRENAKAVIEWAQLDPMGAAEGIIGVLTAGDAPKASPALLAAALLASGAAGPVARSAILPLLSRLPIATHLFEFLENYKGLGGKWGRATRTAISRWYTSRDYEKLEYQMVKYQNREGWSHRDVLRLAHVTPVPFTGMTDLFAYAVGKGEMPKTQRFEGIRLIREAKKAATAAAIVRQYRLTREMIPSQWLNEAEVALALLESAPATAMLRNLSSFTRAGAITDRGSGGDIVTERLTDPVYMAASKLHPVNVLIAWRTYSQGRSLKGTGTWVPVRRVTEALEEAFYLSFKSLPKIGRATIGVIDTSGSMTQQMSSVPLACSEAGCALMMALVRASEPGHVAVFGCDSPGHIYPMPITNETKLSDAVSLGQFRGGSTDLSAPMELARQVNRRLEAGVQRPEGFLMITDNEHNARVRPAESLRLYRQESGIDNAAAVVMSMTAGSSTILDPNDPYSLETVGFDTSTAPLVQDFLG